MGPVWPLRWGCHGSIAVHLGSSNLKDRSSGLIRVDALKLWLSITGITEIHKTNKQEKEHLRWWVHINYNDNCKHLLYALNTAGLILDSVQVGTGYCFQRSNQPDYPKVPEILLLPSSQELDVALESLHTFAMFCETLSWWYGLENATEGKNKTLHNIVVWRSHKYTQPVHFIWHTLLKRSSRLNDFVTVRNK